MGQALVADADLVTRIYMQKLAVVFALRSNDAVSIAPWQAGGNVEGLVDDGVRGKDLHWFDVISSSFHPAGSRSFTRLRAHAGIVSR